MNKPLLHSEVPAVAATDSQNILIELAAETNTGRLLEKILHESQRISGADGGTIYLLNDNAGNPELTFALLVNQSLSIHRGGFGGQEIDLPPIRLYDVNGDKNYNNVVSYAALTKKTVHIHDAYNAGEFDFSGTRGFDKTFHYHSKSFLTVPLLNHDNDVIGVLQLLNALDEEGQPCAFSESAITQVTGLSGYAAVALNNHLLVKDLKNLLDAFIQCIAQAIDAKSFHTSAHCQRIPLLMELFAQAACEDQTLFKDFSLDDDGWYELRVASWLHDCGKLSTPDTVLDKSTKLHLMQDGIELIKIRFAAAKLAAEKQYYQQLSLDASAREELESVCQRQLSALDDDLAFIVKSNQGGEFMAAEAKARLQHIAQQSFIDSAGQVVALLNSTEVDYLCIERGTLSKAERDIINNHMSVTIDMLESLPFPRKLKRVPEYAGGHHEKMNGTGFPKGLKRDQMSIPARMMAIADIFEALTSKERPYKAPMKISEALRILNRMRDDQHVDPDLLELFVRARVWDKYGQRELLPEQLDI